MKLWTFGLAVSALILSQSCKPKADSTLSDAATTSSFKTGFFLPKGTKEYSLRQSTHKPWEVSEFMSRFRTLTATGANVKLWKPTDGTDYGVAVTGAGEQVLVTYSHATESTPVLSITPDNKVWDWGPYVLKEGATIAITELFVRRPYAAKQQGEIDLTVSNMFVRRQALNVDGDFEPVMVPWLAHVSSESGKAIVFRMGNTILDARSGKPVLEFRRLSEGPAWAVLGTYQDDDVKAGTVFWKGKGEEYFSTSAGKSVVVKWKKQDDDSIDRVGTVDASDVKMPADVEAYLESAGPKVAGKQILLGFDWLDGDSSVIQLERISKTFGKVAGGSALGLTAVAGEKDEFSEDDYAPRLGLRTWSQWWAGESETKPVQKIQTGQGYSGVVFTDQTGQQHGGAMLAERNDPNGNRIYTVLNRTTNQVQQVSADGHTLGSPISLNDYKLRAQGNVDRMETMRNNGELAASDASAIRTAQSLDARATRQLEKSESLIPGSTVSEMAGGQLRRVGVAAVTQEAKDQIGKVTGNGRGSLDLGIDKALVGEASRTLDRGAPGSAKVVASDSEAMLVDVSKELAKGQFKSGAAQDASGIAIDTAVEAKKRAMSGDFSTDNPDFAFDSQVSGAAVAGTAVTGAMGSIVKQGIPEGTPGRAAAGKGMEQYARVATNGTEALSRAWYAETLSQQASESLDQAIERRQVNGAYQQGLSTLDVLGEGGPGVRPGESAPVQQEVPQPQAPAPAPEVQAPAQDFGGGEL